MVKKGGKKIKEILGANALQEIGPELLANLFLPPLLYAGAYVLPRKVLAKCSVHIALLGFVGVLTSTGMAGKVILGGECITYHTSHVCRRFQKVHHTFNKAIL